MRFKRKKKKNGGGKVQLNLTTPGFCQRPKNLSRPWVGLSSRDTTRFCLTNYVYTNYVHKLRNTNYDDDDADKVMTI